MTRSEVLRDLARAEVARAHVAKGAPAVAALTLVYDHHVRELTERLTEFQHQLGDRGALDPACSPRRSEVPRGDHPSRPERRAETRRRPPPGDPRSDARGHRDRRGDRRRRPPPRRARARACPAQEPRASSSITSEGPPARSDEGARRLASATRTGSSPSIADDNSPAIDDFERCHECPARRIMPHRDYTHTDNRTARSVAVQSNNQFCDDGTRLEHTGWYEGTQRCWSVRSPPHQARLRPGGHDSPAAPRSRPRRLAVAVRLATASPRLRRRPVIVSARHRCLRGHRSHRIRRRPAKDAPANDPRRAALGRKIFFDGVALGAAGDELRELPRSRARLRRQQRLRRSASPWGAAPEHFARRNTPSVLYLRFVPRFHFHWEEDVDLPDGVGGFFWDGRVRLARAARAAAALQPRRDERARRAAGPRQARRGRLRGRVSRGVRRRPRRPRRARWRPSGRRSRRSSRATRWRPSRRSTTTSFAGTARSAPLEARGLEALQGSREGRVRRVPSS